MKKCYVIGIGPGQAQQMSAACFAALSEAEIFVGYKTYIDLIKPLYPEKEIFATGMMGEEERCRKALELAASGKTVAVISSGDPGVYGMASLILELAGETPPCEIEIIPGISAALSGASLLGSPLTNDFVCISLSDLLTPWETIEKRLRAAAEGGFCTVLYNPGSKRRTEVLRKAAEIFLQKFSGQTVCGICRQIGRPGESLELLTLEELKDRQVDMLSTVFIGNEATRVINGRMVTLRGYRLAAETEEETAHA